jgi:hypothetical protein
MRTRNRLSLLAIGLFALGAAVWACQVQDGSFPTEAERSIEPSATEQEIIDMINALMPRVIAEATVAKFQGIANDVEAGQFTKAQKKTKSLTTSILNNYAKGRWEDEGGVATGELVVAMWEFVGLVTEEADAAAACTPGVDCEVVATEGEEFGGSEVPGEVITQPFVLSVTRLPDDFAPPPRYPIFYEIHTIPEGITFPPAPSGSLTLAQVDDQAVAGVCTLDENEPVGAPADAVPGVNLFLAHQLPNGSWEQLPYLDVAFLNCEDASSETESALWSSPLGRSMAYVADLLSPARAYAGGKSTGGAITSFSPFGSWYTDPVPTTTSFSFVEETTTFFAGDTITLRAEVDPTPDGGNVAFYATIPVHVGAPIAPVVDGVATRNVVCGSPRVPFGSHTAQAEYLGSANFAGSASNTIDYECLEGGGGEE